MVLKNVAMRTTVVFQKDKSLTSPLETRRQKRNGFPHLMAHILEGRSNIGSLDPQRDLSI